MTAEDDETCFQCEQQFERDLSKLETIIKGQKALIAEQKKQVIGFDNQYVRLLEEVETDFLTLCTLNMRKVREKAHDFHEKYKRKLWSQKKS